MSNSNCLKNILKSFGFRFFEAKIYFDYEQTISLGIYNNQIFLSINKSLFKLTNIIKFNETNYKLLFIDIYEHVSIISVSKKTTYLWIEILDYLLCFEKSIIVDNQFSKSLQLFFEKYNNLIELDYSIIEEFIVFLKFQDIYW